MEPATLGRLGERQILIDCDVIQADGGTRTASISGAYVALALAMKKLLSDGRIAENPLTGSIAAISVGIVNGVPLLDLDYPEDSGCDSDINVVMNGEGKIIEIQGTAEGAPFDFDELAKLIKLAQPGQDVCVLVVAAVLAVDRATRPMGTTERTLSMRWLKSAADSRETRRP